MVSDLGGENGDSSSVPDTTLDLIEVSSMFKERCEECLLTYLSQKAKRAKEKRKNREVEEELGGLSTRVGEASGA